MAAAAAAATPAVAPVTEVWRGVVTPSAGAAGAADMTRITPNDAVAPPVYTRTLFIYADAADAAPPAVAPDAELGRRLAAAVQTVVDAVPALGGALELGEERIVPVIAGGRGGARVVVATAAGRSAEVAAMEPDAGRDTGYAMPSYLWVEEARDPLLALHVTRLDDGWVVGVSSHHTLMDGSGHFAVCAAVADAMRGVPPTTPLCGDRAPLYATGTAGTSVPHPEYAVAVPHVSLATATRDGELSPVPPPAAPPSLPPLTVRHLRMSAAGVAAAREAAAAEGLPRATTHDVVTALLWRAVSRARGLEPDAVTKVGYACNGRRRMTPPLPDGYVGNVNLWPCVRRPVRELLDGSWVATGAAVHAATDAVDDAFIRSSLEFIAAVPNKRTIQPAFAPFLSADLAVTNWSRFPMYDVDFGFGRPIAVRLPAAPMDGLAIVLPPLPRHADTDAVRILFGLRSSQWPALAADAELAAYGIAVPPA